MNIISHPPIITNNVQFKSKKAEQTPSMERVPFFPETEAVIDKVYENYRKSLNEVSFKDIKTTALEVSQETQTPKKEVLKAMQLLTQFSNMNDLKVISKEINKAKIDYLGNERGELSDKVMDNFNMGNVGRICKETGIHRSLAYLLDSKELAPFKFFDSNKIGIILDEEKIEQLEFVKKSQPDEFKDLLKDKKIKFFYISGWDSGVSIYNRTKDLKTETKALLERAKEQNLPLEEAIDYPYIGKIKDLGINPIVIKNENEANEIAVYNQMRPEQIRTKESLYNMIEANTLYRGFDLSDERKSIANHVTAKYLQDTLSVYTFEQMSQDLKNLHEKINEYAESSNKEPIYLIPNKSIKSSDFVNYSYKKINNVDSSKFLYMDQVHSYFRRNKDKADNSMVVILDDCALSGNSMNSLLIDMHTCCLSSKVPILFANLKGSRESLNNFINPTSNPVGIISADKIKPHRMDNIGLEDIIGKPQYKDSAYSLVLPYMSPDNNSEFATNIALLHNSKYNNSNFSSESKGKIVETDYSPCTKNITDDVISVSEQYAKMIGLSHLRSENKIDPRKLDIESSEIYSGYYYI